MTGANSVLRSGVRILVLLAGATLIGVGYGRYRQIPLVPDVQQIKEERDQRAIWVQQTGIDLADFVRHYQAGRLVIDARAPEAFEEGHLDAPLIMNIPAEAAHDCLHRALSFIGTPIVIYCSSADCESAQELWDDMRSWAFPPETLRVFHPGWIGIQEAKLPIARGPDMFQDDLGQQSEEEETSAVEDYADAAAESGEEPQGDDSSGAEEEQEAP